MHPSDCPAFRSLAEAAIFLNTRVSLLIYDNSPHPQIYSPHQAFNTLYYHNPANPGVGQAYNYAATIAQKLKKNWLLLADQDTRFHPSLLNEYQKILVSFPNTNLIIPQLKDGNGLVSPFDLKGGRAFRRKNVSTGPANLENHCFINSGLLIHTALFSTAGGYDSRFMLDFSDLYFRFKLLPCKPNMVIAPLLGTHALAVPEKMNALPRFQLYTKALIDFSSLTNIKTFKFQLLLRSLHLALRMGDFSFIAVAIKALAKRESR